MRRLVAGSLLLLITTSSLAQDSLPLDCSRQAVDFTSGRFELAGDLLTPRDAASKHPVIIYVWGAGPSNRQRHIDRSSVLRAFLGRGYAVFLYDKPGSGGSTGEIDSAHQFEELSAILVDAIKWLAQRPEINPLAIGLFGSSQASYVMAKSFARSSHIAFVMAWSCPMQNSIEQGAYLVRNYVLCDGGSKDIAAIAAKAYRQRALARSYAEYRDAAATLNDVTAIREGLGWAGVEPESDFTPADTTTESFFDPSVAFATLRIPLLALYAENDRQIDAAQGAEACRRMLAGAEHPLSSVEMIPGADHNMIISPRGCMQDQRDDYKSVGGRVVSPVFIDTMSRWLGQLKSKLLK